MSRDLSALKLKYEYSKDRLLDELKSNGLPFVTLKDFLYETLVLIYRNESLHPNFSISTYTVGQLKNILRERGHPFVTEKEFLVQTLIYVNKMKELKNKNNNNNNDNNPNNNIPNTNINNNNIIPQINNIEITNNNQNNQNYSNNNNNNNSRKRILEFEENQQQDQISLSSSLDKRIKLKETNENDDHHNNGFNSNNDNSKHSYSNRNGNNGYIDTKNINYNDNDNHDDNNVKEINDNYENDNNDIIHEEDSADIIERKLFDRFSSVYNNILKDIINNYGGDIGIQLVREYNRFLVIKYLENDIGSNKLLGPPLIDQFWSLHILNYTQSYNELMGLLGITTATLNQIECDNGDILEKQTRYTNTLNSYRKNFGEIDNEDIWINLSNTDDEDDQDESDN